MAGAAVAHEVTAGSKLPCRVVEELTAKPIRRPTSLSLRLGPERGERLPLCG